MNYPAAMLALICWVLAGFDRRDRLRRRAVFLESMFSFLQTVQARVGGCLEPPASLIKCGRGEFFSLCSELSADNGDIRTGWVKAMDCCEDVKALSLRERSLCREIGSGLGLYDAELQLSVTSSQLEELREIKNKARLEAEEKGRVTLACTTLFGLLTALLII